MIGGVPAIFFDRDGTLNVDVGFCSSPDQIELLPGAADAVRSAAEAGFRTIIVTNQSGVARGLIEESQLGPIHDRLRELLAAAGAYIDGIYYCPHYADGSGGPYDTDCRCRKPKLGLIEKAARDHSINLAQSAIIGDKLSDVETGWNAGARSYLVLTGNGREEKNKIISRSHGRVFTIAPTALEAVQSIIHRRAL